MRQLSLPRFELLSGLRQAASPALSAALLQGLVVLRAAELLAQLSGPAPVDHPQRYECGDQDDPDSDEDEDF